jgi:hypothetical protein
MAASALTRWTTWGSNCGVMPVEGLHAPMEGRIRGGRPAPARPADRWRAPELPLQAPASGPRMGMGRRRDGDLADNAGSACVAVPVEGLHAPVEGRINGGRPVECDVVEIWGELDRDR